MSNTYNKARELQDEAFSSARRNQISKGYPRYGIAVTYDSWGGKPFIHKVWYATPEDREKGFEAYRKKMRLNRFGVPIKLERIDR